MSVHDENFCEDPLNLYENRGVTANGFFTTGVMGSDNPADGGERRLVLRHGGFIQESGKRVEPGEN